MNTLERKVQDSASIVLAIILIALGALFLLDQWLHINLAGYLWPFIVIVPGVLMFILALTLSSPEGEGLAIFGSIMTMVGLLLLLQNTTGLWATWAYAWALVAPTSVGLGMMVYGMLKGRQNLVTAGAVTAKVGISLFIGFGVFFELILGVSGLGLNRIGLPLLLIAVGVYAMWRAVHSR